jgi:hypothetical protein
MTALGKCTLAAEVAMKLLTPTICNALDERSSKNSLFQASTKQKEQTLLRVYDL